MAAAAAALVVAAAREGTSIGTLVVSRRCKSRARGISSGDAGRGRWSGTRRLRESDVVWLL